MMSRRMVFMGAVALACAGLRPALAQEVPADISGSYRVEGRNPDGSAYHGQLIVVQGAGGAVACSWVVGKQSYNGTGRREGRVVTIDWGAADPVVYVVMPGGRMYATWADGRAVERAEK